MGFLKAPFYLHLVFPIYIYIYIYMLPLGPICQKHNVTYHCYDDDTQFYFPLKVNDSFALTSLLDYQTEINI